MYPNVSVQLPSYFFNNQTGNNVPQLYPIVPGVDSSHIKLKVQRRIHSNQQAPTSNNHQTTKVFYPNVAEVDYYYQRFYGAKPGSKWINSTLHFNPWNAQSWMRPQTSHPDDMNHLYPVISMPPPTPVINIEEFQKLRHHATIESALKQLNELATCLDGKETSDVPDRITRACFICANSYTKKKYLLGVGPLNDSVTVAANHKHMGYDVFYVHNPKSTFFLKLLRVFLERSTEYLTVFFTGHGSNVKNTDGTEASGFDQVMIFDDDYIKDDTLASYLKKYSNGSSHTLLLTDCCHSGTIWDIPDDPVKAMEFPGNIISISSSDDANTAKQLTINNNTQGLFTFFFWKTLKEHPEYTFLQVKPIVDREIKKFRQECILHATRPYLLEKVFFPPH